MALTLFWLVEAGAAALPVFFLLGLAGVVSLDATADRPRDTFPRATASAPPAARDQAAVPEPVARPAGRSARPARRPAPGRSPAARPARLAAVTIRATRGDCWVLARARSENGRTLAERVLLEGESMTVRARSVWLSLGASANVDVTVNGTPRELPFGTVDVVLTPAGSA